MGAVWERNAKYPTEEMKVAGARGNGGFQVKGPANAFCWLKNGVPTVLIIRKLRELDIHLDLIIA